MNKGSVDIKKRSPLWYELPILFFIVGGVIAFFKIRKDDQKKAKLCLIIGIIFTVPLLIGYGLTPFGQMYVVSSGNMMPELQVYDLLFLSSSVPFAAIPVGDIIAFDRPSDQKRIIIHRVTAITDDNPLTLRTKGDANPASIPGTDFPITEKEYRGKVVTVIPEFGKLFGFYSAFTAIFIQPIIAIIPIILHLRLWVVKKSPEDKPERL